VAPGKTLFYRNSSSDGPSPAPTGEDAHFQKGSARKRKKPCRTPLEVGLLSMVYNNPPFEGVGEVTYAFSPSRSGSLSPPFKRNITSLRKERNCPNLSKVRIPLRQG